MPKMTVNVMHSQVYYEDSNLKTHQLNKEISIVSMQYGVILPNMDVDARTLAELAALAEAAGWDGVLVWDCLYGSPVNEPERRHTCDPWIALAAIALCTQRLRLGTMVTPLSRRRPWKVARE